jgi:iron(II)-dependent oxidoreductase
MKRAFAIATLIATLSLPGNGATFQLTKTMKSQPDGAEMILVPAGSFVYGSDQNELRSLLRSIKAGWADIFNTEQRRQTKILPAFYIDRFEVTNELYNRFVQVTKYQRPSRFARYPQLNAPRQPIVGVGWIDAEAYCRWSKKRLPTEEEWEKAARGTDGRTWPWGNEPEDSRFNGVSAGNFGPVAVGSFPKGDSPYGVADMAGNVWEMTSGNWQGSAKAMRGGSFLNSKSEVRVTVRWSAGDEARGANWLGFRCAVSADAPR